jgi:L-aspartate oxidase
LIRDAEGLTRVGRSGHLLVRLIATSALARRESRGGHFRSDFPLESDEFAAHSVVRPGQAPVFERWT